MPVGDVDECFVVVVVEAANGAEVGDVYVDGRGRGGGSGEGGEREEEEELEKHVCRPQNISFAPPN